MDRESVVGKYVLIGITFLDDRGKLIEQFQTHGPIVLVDDNKGIVIEKSDGSGSFGIPPDIKSLRPAPPGQYRLRSTGKVIDDPDFVSTWTVDKTTPETIEKYKSSGFTNFSAPKAIEH